MNKKTKAVAQLVIKMKSFRFSFFVFAALILLCFAACSTKKNTWTSRAYHNVNAEFNVKFNAKEAFKTGVKKADAYLPQEYDQLPPVFSYVYKEIPGKVSSEMDRVIEKSEKLVMKHSITAKPKKASRQMDKKERDFYNQREFCKVIDDAYLLSGKANLYLQEYDKAIAVFDHILMEYPKSSSVQETKIQLAGALIRVNDLDKAQRLLQESSKEKKISKKLNTLLDATYADYYIQKKDFATAATHLEKALENESKKANKIRYYFILAEMYGSEGKNSQAIDYLNKAIRLNPPYSAVFAAQMRKAALYDPATQSANLRKDLLTMLNDDKNEEYVDQIYFALAQVEKASGKDSLAIDYLEKSIKAESSNDNQKAKAHLLLGDYDYARKRFAESYNNYKSALDLLDSDDLQYDTLSKKADGLQRLAENYTIVKTEDSLQRIAKMPAAERDAWINAMIAKVMEQEKQDQEDLKQQQYYRYQQERDRYGTNTTAQGSSWYFYNTASINSGLSGFTMRWGKRKLEDDWRRRNKREVQTYSAQSDAKDGSSSADKPMSPTSREYYTKDLPLTEKAMEASNIRLSDALFKLGEAYKDDVHEPRNAIGSFRRLDVQFPQDGNRASTYFYLYQLYEQTHRPDSSIYYKERLIANYPKGPLTQQLTNPNYFAEQQAIKTAMEAEYEKIFNAYSARRYSEASTLAQQMMQTYPNSLLQPQLEYIRALCTGANGDVASYKAALTTLVKQYPTSEVAQIATDIIKELEKNELAYTPTTSGSTPSTTPDIPATYEQSYKFVEGTQYVGFLCEKEKNTNELLFVLESYNADAYLDKNLEILTRDIGTNYTLIYISEFESILDAQNYYNAMQQANTFAKYSTEEFRRIIISQDNLTLLEQSRDIAAYLRFFTTNYLK